jgi:hypothetical protein
MKIFQILIHPKKYFQKFNFVIFLKLKNCIKQYFMKYPKCNKIIITKDRFNLIKIKWIVQKNYCVKL